MSDDGAQHSIGRLIGAGEQRDAIHVAVLPMEAGQVMSRGTYVTIENGKAVAVGDPGNALGIVDPYLGFEGGQKYVSPGEWFWLCILPRRTTSLRHAWSHPAIDDDPTTRAATGPNAHRTWLENSAHRTWLENWWSTADGGVSLDTFLEAVRDGSATEPDPYDRDYSTTVVVDGDGVYVSGSDAHGMIPDTVWEHIEALIGRPVTERPAYFSCSC